MFGVWLLPLLPFYKRSSGAREQATTNTVGLRGIVAAASIDAAFQTPVLLALMIMGAIWRCLTFAWTALEGVK